jgi:rhodanese-related sulfurtransferase
MELVSPLSTRNRIPGAKLGIFMTALIVLVAAVSFGRTRVVEWFVLDNAIRFQHPAIHLITREQLTTWLNDAREEKPLLFDVRSKEEFDVSHLPTARRVDPGATATAAAGGVSREKPIVVYCAVGYRSSALAQQLQAAGFTNVRYLEGGIFAWADEHRPMISADGNSTRRVLPRNEWWSKLLDDDVRADVAPIR